MIKLQASCQVLKVCCSDVLVSDSLNAIKMQFAFTNEWRGLSKTVQFVQKDEETEEIRVYNVLLDDENIAMLPNEITTGTVLVSVFGVDGDTKRLTTNAVAFPVTQSGFMGDGQTPIPPTPDLYQQYVNLVYNAAGVPVIGENGNWHLNDVDTGIKADWSAEQENAAASAEEAATSAAEAEASAARAEAVKASIPEDYTALSEEVKGKTDYLSVITDGHFWAIPYTFNTNGDYYKEVDGAPVVQGQRPSSGKIPAPKNLRLDFGSDGKAQCYIYFYTLNEEGEFVETFAPFYYVASSNNMVNFVSSSSVPSWMIADIPDGTYMEIGIERSSTELVSLYGWDGEPFGMDVCATSSTPVIDPDGAEAWMSEKGGSGITVHGKAKHLFTNGAKLGLVFGYKNGEYVTLNESARAFYTLPEGYDHFRIRLVMDTEDGRLKTFTGDVRTMVHIVASTTEERPIANAAKVIENCKRACDLTWTPQMEIKANNGGTPSFKPDVEYNGLIYASQWDKARIVGWHVSPHTFVNAVNDAGSIMYKETAESGGVVAPFYGTVCSAFATMCAGWECPQTNAGFFYDPDIETYYSHKPQLGQIYTDIMTHCVIPAGITQIGDDSIVTAYEAINPVSLKTTRFMSIARPYIWEWWNTAAGLDYYYDYGYVVHNPKAKPDMSTVPYADFANVAITNGSARPYKGDKSVYTSAEEEVLINIKNEAATVLYLEAEDGSVQQIPIDGASEIDVKPYLVGSKENVYGDKYAIYDVYTDADGVKESFEYIEVTPATYTLDADSLAFGDNKFWYADCGFAGLHYYQRENGSYENRTGSVLANPTGDYSKWFRNGNSITAVYAVFRKGSYGAYTVPIPQNETK